MKKSLGFQTLSLCLTFAITFGSIGIRSKFPVADAASWEERVDPWVVNSALEKGETEFLVFLSEQADLSEAELLKGKLEKGYYVYETLTSVAQRTQRPIIEQLEALGVDYQPFWVANMIWVRGSLTILQAMVQRSDVAYVYANPVVRFESLPESDQKALLNPSAIEWNLLTVNADDVWAQGITGQGAVIGGQDTGYDWDHPALINQYRGWDESSEDHNYNWHDAIHSGGGVCGADSLQPCDDHGHGTHTMGTMVGDDGGTNQIGMAPGAKWIGCRNMDQGNGTPTTYAECYQWFIAPTDLNGKNPDPSKAPDVINNSWSCPPSEGCTDPNVLLAVVQAVRAAGILTVHSAGNSGFSGCSTVNTPSAIYAESFSVGSTTNTDTLSSFSSRGPVMVDGSNRLKPDITAPGSGIRSSQSGGGYTYLSGTSMAGPHVAGLVGLLISANPSLSGQVDFLEDIIQQTAAPVSLNPVETCGGIPSTEIPNNSYGWGRIDAYSAYRRALYGQFEIANAPSHLQIQAGDYLTYTITVSHTLAISTTYNIVLSDTLPTQTTFITATLPHTLDGSIINWANPAMAPDSSWKVNLVVQVEKGASGKIENLFYGVKSSEIPVVNGLPVITVVKSLFEYFFPNIYR